MPAPIDWSAAGGIDSVRQLTIAVGPREAARRLGLSDAHSDALRKKCSREHWMDAVRQPAPPLPASMSQPVQSQPCPQHPVPSGSVSPEMSPEMSPALQSSAVTGVTKASDAMADALAEDSRETRIGLSRAARSAADRARTMGGDEVIASARQLKDVAGIASTIHGWDAQSGTARISIYGGQVAIVERASDGADTA